MTEIERALRTSESSLQQIDQTPFSQEGFKRLTTRVNEYVIRLIAESVKVAHARGSDTISPAYVDHASQYLAAGKGSKVYRFIGVLGGIIFGIGATSVVTMVLTNQYSTRGVIVSFVSTAIGALAISLELTRS